MARMPFGPGLGLAFDGNEAAGGNEHATDLAKSCIDLAPVVHGGNRPGDRHGMLGQGDVFGHTLEVLHRRRVTGQQPRDAQHDGRWIDSGDQRSVTRGVADGHTWAAPEVHNLVTRVQFGKALCQTSVALSTNGHAERGDEAGRAGESGVVGVVVGGQLRLSHGSTLTVEPNFKSSGRMSESLLTIGEVAERAHVATSTVRYYERLGLVVADARVSGQRRYRIATLRRLVFVGMLQDAGLSLTDIAEVLSASDISEWKSIVRRRFEALEAEIAKLEAARAYLAGALFCRFDHPATDCHVMGAEIDRRLGASTDA